MAEDGFEVMTNHDYCVMMLFLVLAWRWGLALGAEGTPRAKPPTPSAYSFLKDSTGFINAAFID